MESIHWCQGLMETQSSRFRRSKLILGFTSSLFRFSKWFKERILCADSPVSILKFLQTSEVQVSFFLFCLVCFCCWCCSFFLDYFPFQDPKFSIRADLCTQREWISYRTMVAWTSSSSVFQIPSTLSKAFGQLIGWKQNSMCLKTQNTLSHIRVCGASKIRALELSW